MIHELLKHQKKLFPLLILLLGTLSLAGTLDFQPILSPGDHGRDYYAFQATAQGQAPYKDYWWVYGPLMPYYYSAFLKFFGMNMASVLLGRFVLLLISVILIYLTLELLVPPVLAFLGSFWFIAFNLDFFFTHNHIGGIMLLLAVLYFLFRFFKTDKRKYIALSFLCAFLVCLVKINYGLAALVCITVMSLLGVQLKNNNAQHRPFILGLFFTATAAAFLCYALLLWGMPMYEIRQCLPYLSSDHPHNSSILNSAYLLANANWVNITTSLPNGIFALLINLCGLCTLLALWQRKMTANDHRHAILAIGTCALFYMVNLHEFLVSAVLYRSFWATPFSITLIFLLMFYATRSLKPLFKFLLYSAIALIVFTKIINGVSMASQRRTPEHFLSMPEARVFVGNDPFFIETVKATVAYLKEHVPADETFFALPYDPLYYFLAQKLSPTRQLIFFDHINIPPEQEHSIIRELEETNVRWVLISSRSRTTEPGLGVLGETYCPVIHQYLTDHFRIVAQFGDWVNPGGWGWNHGTSILKRIK